MTIVEFLSARLDEDEAGALATTPVPLPGRWKVARDKHADDDAPLQLIQGEDPDDHASEEYSSTEVIAYCAYWQAEAEANLRHIARHDPARVLAEVKAKRAIVALHPISSRPEEWGDVRHHPDQSLHNNYMGQLTGGTVYSCGTCDIGVDFESDGPVWRAEEACETVRWMAAPYAEHPDYKQAWSVNAT